MVLWKRLESERISSGYLQDKAIDYVDLGIYDGSALTPANLTITVLLHHTITILPITRAARLLTICKATLIAAIASIYK